MDHGWGVSIYISRAWVLEGGSGGEGAYIYIYTYIHSHISIHKRIDKL